MRAGTAIEVRDLRKSFAVPSADRRTLGDRLKGPVRRGVPGALPVLDGISFDIEEGEFFGIVGRNGSGKSTLIRVLANIYGADSGTVDVRGRVAPVVELGVGFNPELSARANVVLGGVTLGLNREALEDRVEDVLRFAGVARFAEMPVRNFSTGMRTRLAFAVSIEADPDILLLDEALAVGDGDFQERCIEELNRRRDAGKTIVLVTHSIGKIRQHCDRALLLVGGKIAAIGDPDEVGLAYRSDVSNTNLVAHRRGDATDGAEIESVDVLAADENGSIGHRERIEADVTLRILAPRERIGARLEVRDNDGSVVFAVGRLSEQVGPLRPGDRVRVRIGVDNPLTPGEYELGFRALTIDPRGELATDSPIEWAFVSVGGRARRGAGAVEVDSEMEFVAERSGGRGAAGNGSAAESAPRRRGGADTGTGTHRVVAK